MSGSRCHQCGRTLAAGIAFCTHCGCAVGRGCAQCGFANPPDASFCGGCGQSLGGRSPRRAPAREAERRQLTVMFCDLVGSTELSQRLDPEELREAIHAYQQHCAAWIERFEGHVAQYLGDGLLVYFGYPRAHEDDPARALRAALAIVDGLPELNSRLVRALPDLRTRPLDVRVGVHTGPVVVGEMGGARHREELALGDTVNIAARLQGAGRPGWITVSERTARRIPDLCVLEPMGDLELRGVAGPVRAFRALELRDARSRVMRPPTPLVGREHELDLLMKAWSRAVQGHGQVALIRGEPGIGKSRLLRALRERLEGTPHAWLECGCSAMHTGSSFHPVIGLLRQELRLDDKHTTQEVTLQRLTQTLQRAGLCTNRFVSVFAPLLNLPVDGLEEKGAQALSADAQRRRTREAVAAWLVELARLQPVVLAVEDLHWIDPSSLELFQLLADHTPANRVLLIGTERLDRPIDLQPRSYLHTIALGPLAEDQTRALVGKLAEGHALPAEVMGELARRTDGIPLFVEELTKTILESSWFADRSHARPGTGRELAIPSTLQDSLMARLDRLPLGKEVAQLASVIGREFPHALLAAIAPHDEDSLCAALSELGQAELIYERGVPPDTVYFFKHAMVQDVAYQSMLRRRRREIHARIAEALETRFPELTKQQPELLAHHFEAADQPLRAIDAYEDAAQRAFDRSAQTEAILHLRRAIALSDARPSEPAAREQACRQHVALGARLLEARGYGDPEVEQVYRRAIELCGDRATEGPDHFRALWGLSVFYQARSRLHEAVELGQRLVKAAERLEDPAMELMAYQALGSPLLWLGRFEESARCVERSMALYVPELHRRLAHSYGEDPGISTRVYAAQARWYLGFPDQSLAHARAALELAIQGDHPFSQGYARCFLAAIHALRGERELATSEALEALHFAEKQELNLWAALSRFLVAWGETPPGSPSDRAGVWDALLAKLATTGTEVGTPFLLGLFAEALRNCGQLPRALETARAARALADERRCPFWNAELERLEGELLLALDPTAAPWAEASYARALATARSQGALALELRAATSLALERGKRGDREGGRAVLEPLYARFSEGFELDDLIAARRALEA